ncbi:MAG: hypothetical protein ABH810_00025 [bacterium]
MNKFSNITMLLLLTMLPGSALAVSDVDKYLRCMDPTIVGDVAKSSAACEGTGGVESGTAIYTVIDSVLYRLPFFLTALAFAAFLFSGAMYVFAMGDTNKMEAAKKNLTWATIGMLAMSLVLVVIKIIGSLAYWSQTKFINDITDVIGF